MLKKSGLASLLLAALLSGFSWTMAQAGAGESITPVRARFVGTYESLTLPNNEKMGLLGGSLMYGLRDWFSAGGGAYGALAGHRGGFITLGLATELHTAIGEHTEIDAGLFAGAGGGSGGNTLQGGGLMLRTHLGAMWRFGRVGGVGAGASWITFPNGTINTVQPYIYYSLPFSTLIPRGWVDLQEPNSRSRPEVPTAEQEFSMVYRYYNVPGSVVTDSGTPQHSTIGLAGVEWHLYLNEHFFLNVESAGAMQGRSNGYMQILLGGGYRQLLTHTTRVKLSASLGPAGGGDVATGGGLLLDGQLALQQMLGERFFGETGIGYVRSPGSSFRAASFSAKLGYHFIRPKGEGEQVDVADLSRFEWKHFRIRIVNQRYLKGAPDWRNSHADINVDLLGFQIDYFIKEWMYISGQGIGAYRGKAGGYMTGLVGTGGRVPIPGTPLYGEGNALIGAAGGGGLDVEGGLVWQTAAGIGWQLSDAYSLQASFGVIRAAKGHFRARVASLSLGYSFSLPIAHSGFPY